MPLAGYALWAVDRIGASGAVFSGMIFALTTGVALAYAVGTGLRAPRFAAVLAAQPVVPLLAYGWVDGPTGWAVVFTLVAVLDLGLVRSGIMRERPAGPEATPAGPTAPRQRVDPDGRPEAAPEESAEVLAGTAGDPTGGSRPVPWLPETTWLLHGAAVALALAYAVTALLRVQTVPAATGAGAALLLAALVALAGTLLLRRPPLPDLGAGILTLAVIGALGRIAAVAFPGRALLLIAAVITLTGLAVRAVPEAARRGPQLASAAALSVSGLVVAGGALRAGLAPVQAALPAWRADLSRFPAEVAATAGPSAGQLAASALLLTIAAVLALPPEIRREFAVVGAGLTALAVPASLGLGGVAAPWPMVLAAVAIGVAGLSAGTTRAAVVHAGTATAVGFVGAGAALSRPSVTAAALAVLTLAGVLVALAPRVRIAPAAADVVSGWAAGGAAFALPGAVAAFVAATEPSGPVLTPGVLRELTVPILAASFLAVCVTLGYAAMMQVSQRHLSLPHAVGTGLGALAVTGAAFFAPGRTAADAWLGGLVLIATLLLLLAGRIDARRPSDLAFDGADLAAAAVTTALIATLVRITAVISPAGSSRWPPCWCWWSPSPPGRCPRSGGGGRCSASPWAPP